MTTTTVASFEIKYHQYLDPQGKPTQELPAFAKDMDKMRKLYRDMALLRAFDAKAYALQRTGKMGTYPASLGQEAIGIGYGDAMTAEDVLIPYYRSTGAMLKHGITMEEILLYWGGDESGSNYSVAKEDFPICVPIANQIIHASGVAKAIQMRGQKRAVATEIGEGGTSEGDFYEGINVAGIWNLGVVFMVNNNQWAISVPTEIQTACETYAQKAIAAGIEGVQVDGNDIIAVKQVAEYAFEKARNGGGPTLIEAITYRLCDHTTADDASRYDDPKVKEEAWKNEPMVRLRKYLEANKAWSDKDEEAMKAEIAKEVEAAVKAYEETPKPGPELMFDHLYAELPELTKPQREAAIKLAEKARGAK
ncbi:pyruvate dehydrogenase (acetyl-transferring) E1 component subunit alpha [Kangiella profundi]|uniref:Pyruvate dehydrogenase E1 component subunit alpha n=1 Tax=Kangiella profundi TaxID=1561924 RepID=A0A2K9AC53_9GAMM|nr:pyruvate dehydrogenase (acetyl-transferring) E1 component subunit alpha [Kangiella profundi]AUD79007.1 pyruvate dehydrogenase (acetyl-transferring) E1 component subunit alpha [Kangiella profundi]GGF02277.1 pyruvate dehydrogenase (acetyl-transferring) E1 component subunit alpha [Kangiella profundi]